MPTQLHNTHSTKVHANSHKNGRGSHRTEKKSDCHKPHPRDCLQPHAASLHRPVTAKSVAATCSLLQVGVRALAPEAPCWPPLQQERPQPTQEWPNKPSPGWPALSSARKVHGLDWWMWLLATSCCNLCVVACGVRPPGAHWLLGIRVHVPGARVSGARVACITTRCRLRHRIVGRRRAPRLRARSNAAARQFCFVAKKRISILVELAAWHYVDVCFSVVATPGKPAHA